MIIIIIITLTHDFNFHEVYCCWGNTVESHAFVRVGTVSRHIMYHQHLSVHPHLCKTTWYISSDQFNSVQGELGDISALGKAHTRSVPLHSIHHFMQSLLIQRERTFQYEDINKKKRRYFFIWRNTHSKTCLMGSQCGKGGNHPNAWTWRTSLPRIRHLIAGMPKRRRSNP